MRTSSIKSTATVFTLALVVTSTMTVSAAAATRTRTSSPSRFATVVRLVLARVFGPVANAKPSIPIPEPTPVDPTVTRLVPTDENQN